MSVCSGKNCIKADSCLRAVTRKNERGRIKSGTCIAQGFDLFTPKLKATPNVAYIGKVFQR